MEWPDVQDLLDYWALHPPIHDLARMVAEAFGVKIKMTKTTNLNKGNGAMPGGLAVPQTEPGHAPPANVKTFDQLPLAVQKLFHDAKHANDPK